MPQFWETPSPLTAWDPQSRRTTWELQYERDFRRHLSSQTWPAKDCSLPQFPSLLS